MKFFLKNTREAWAFLLIWTLGMLQFNIADLFKESTAITVLFFAFPIALLYGFLENNHAQQKSSLKKDSLVSPIGNKEKAGYVVLTAVGIVAWIYFHKTSPYNFTDTLQNIAYARILYFIIFKLSLQHKK